jgi:ArsR family transcriptional regulator
MDGLIARQAPPERDILDRMSVVSDPIRCRVLLVLEKSELAVSELCATLQLPQSTVSRHLKVLADKGWVTARREGTSRRYGTAALPDSALRLWRLVRDELVETPWAHEDERRLESVLARRSARSRAFFSSAAGGWTKLRSDLFGRRFDLEALLGLIDESWTVGDLGAGTGPMAASLAPYVHRVIAVDDSPEMLSAAARQLSGIDNVELRNGKLEELPIEDRELDVALLILVLHHLADPGRVLSEAARVLRPGGRVLVVDMLPHEREEYRREMGHVWLGFSEKEIFRWLEAAGLGEVRFHLLTPDPEAAGPSLFTATASRSASTTDLADRRRAP